MDRAARPELLAKVEARLERAFKSPHVILKLVWSGLSPTFGRNAVTVTDSNTQYLENERGKLSRISLRRRQRESDVCM
jgi:hypothetical protein